MKTLMNRDVQSIREIFPPSAGCLKSFTCGTTQTSLVEVKAGSFIPSHITLTKRYFMCGVKTTSNSALDNFVMSTESGGHDENTDICSHV